ncbi:MAG: DNA mismatch repair endonuclease MutL [Clostridia bacterium]|nr:DNA mismatch repair endonuclease MutL [Clostridia bacterium]
MKKINVLNNQTAQLIAAGEVVENPASVVKELLENAIDSGANRIELEIKNGGIKYIKVSDNGSGIFRDDVRNAFLRHATSKLRSAEDLKNINSLGFRGEALASICAVSKVEVITKSKNEQIGTHYYITGGVSGKLEDIGCSDGTTIIVKDLFFNTPARMKFLKKDVSEANSCAALIDKLALSHPEISFKFIRDGKNALCTSGNGKLSSAIYSVCGKDFFNSLIETNYELNGINVCGFITKPVFSKSTRSMQYFFVNGRYIKNKSISTALEEAFKNSIMVGKFPGAVLYLKISPELIDVNVHPTKTEIKFANEKSVFETIYYAVKSSLMSQKNALSDTNIQNLKANDISRDIFNMNIPKPKFKDTALFRVLQQIKHDTNKEDSNTINLNLENNSKKIRKNKSEETNINEKLVKNVDFGIDNECDDKKEINIMNEFNDDLKTNHTINKFPENSEKIIKNETFFNKAESEKINIVGEIFDCYIIVEYKSDMILIDKHAAHERLLFEKLKKNDKCSGMQNILKPIMVTLEKKEYGALIENQELILNAGFLIEDFGDGTVMVRSIPMYVNLPEVSDIMSEIANYILNNKKDIATKKLDWIYHNIACRSAIKAGKESSKEEILELVKNLILNPDVSYCPHGRPIFVSITKNSIEKKFGRL